MRDISLIVNARVESSRMHHKLIRKFANTTLLDICLTKLSLMGDCIRYLAANENEILSIYEKYQNSGIELIVRSKESVRKGITNEAIMFEHYRKIPTRYIMWINPCCPFVKVNTFIEAGSIFLEKKCKTLTSVKRRNNIFFDSQSDVINVKHPCRVTSNCNEEIYEMAHVLHVFDRDSFLDKGYFWDYTEKNPYLFVVNEPEFFDIDTETEFFLYENMYKNVGEK